MDFAPTEEQLLVQRTARDAADRVCSPRGLAARDLSGAFPVAELRELALLGLLGVAVPEAHGGSGAGAIAYSLALQELARGDASVAVAVSVTNMVAELIAAVGTREQALRWVPGLCSGELVCGAFGLSASRRPDRIRAAMRTTATKTAHGWRLDGAKQWTTSGDHAGCIIVWAVTEPGAGHQGITAFVVPGKATGLTVARLEDKLGLHGSSTAQLALDGIEVGDDAVLGGIGGGFALAMRALDGGRIGIASQAIGIARRRPRGGDSLRRRARATFGQPIIKHQAIALMLADAATWLDAGALLTLRAAADKQAGRPYRPERGDGEAVLLRARLRDLRHRVASARRLRLRARLSRRARAARRPRHADLRRHERDPTPSHRAQLAARAVLNYESSHA